MKNPRAAVSIGLWGPPPTADEIRQYRDDWWLLKLGDGSVLVAGRWHEALLSSETGDAVALDFVEAAIRIRRPPGPVTC